MKISTVKSLLLTAAFTLVFMFLIHTEYAYAAPTSSVKTKISTKKINTSVRYKVASRTSEYTVNSSTVNSLVSYAREFIGAKYKYGAFGPDKFDCSGFTMCIMMGFGVNLPHSASAQSRYVYRVSRVDLKPGDLVFFATSELKKISHVGIYIGNNCFIHSSSGAGVVISSLNEGYYKRNYVTAGRAI